MRTSLWRASCSTWKHHRCDQSGQPRTHRLESARCLSYCLWLSVAVLNLLLRTLQYLRKALFPVHRDLRYAGLLNPLACPHHPSQMAFPLYREGVVVSSPPDGGGSFVSCGLFKDVQIDRRLQHNVRLTVKIEPEMRHQQNISGTAVSSTEPREKHGTYWGYTVRLASGLTAVSEECPYEGGYDLKLGTSERGLCVDDVNWAAEPKAATFKHLLIVLGGVAGLEDVVSADPVLRSAIGDGDEASLFDYYLNVCPNQGSNTIRTEEAMLVTLSALRPVLLQRP